MLAILFSVAAGCVCWRKKNSEKEKASQVSGVVSFKKKRQVYGDIPSFKVTGAYGQRPESFLSTAMKSGGFAHSYMASPDGKPSAICP